MKRTPVEVNSRVSSLLRSCIRSLLMFSFRTSLWPLEREQGEWTIRRVTINSTDRAVREPLKACAMLTVRLKGFSKKARLRPGFVGRVNRFCRTMPARPSVWVTVGIRLYDCDR